MAVEPASGEGREQSSYLATYLAMLKVLHISAPTILDAMTNRLTIETCDRRMKALGDFVLRRARARLTIEGLERLDPARAYLFMSNHESLMDIPLLFATCPKPPRMVTKKELFKVPIWGKALELAGFIPIDRGDRAQAIESLRQARALIERGINVWIAPEGTRSRDGSLLRFKKGGFMLALELGLAIVPVGLHGARRIIRPKTFRSFLDQDVSVRFGAPIEAASFGLAHRDALMEQVRLEIDRLRRPADPVRP